MRVRSDSYRNPLRVQNPFGNKGILFFIPLPVRSLRRLLPSLASVYEYSKLSIFVYIYGETFQNVQNGNTDELSTAYNNAVSSVMEYALTNPTQQEATTKGTLYGAYNAVTGYFQNVRNFKDDESKVKSIMHGTGLQRSQSTFSLCEEYEIHRLTALNYLLREAKNALI